MAVAMIATVAIVRANAITRSVLDGLPKNRQDVRRRDFDEAIAGRTISMDSAGEGPGAIRHINVLLASRPELSHRRHDPSTTR
jgi:hypothetical protein